MKKIAVVGSGHVGLVTGAVLAEAGHTVVCYDISPEKIDSLQRGVLPFYEHGLGPLIEKNSAQKRLTFTDDLSLALQKAGFIFITVPTPGQADGNLSIDNVLSACSAAAPLLCSNAIFVIKSTVLPGTCATIQRHIAPLLPNGISADVVANPEFLREGNAVEDMIQPDRIIIGTESPTTAEAMKELYTSFHAPIMITGTQSAEMIKMGSNAFLAVKISFINELANLCAKNGADIEHVAYGMGLDQRIGLPFLQAGAGYGGSCFPKDTKGLLFHGKENGTDLSILESAIKVNNRRPLFMVDLAKQHFTSLKGKKAAVLGLSFKPNTDDIRNAPSLILIDQLLSEGVEVSVYDPKALKSAKAYFGNKVTCCNSLQAALAGAEMAFIMTEWEQIIGTALQVFAEIMKEPVIFDGRNSYPLQEAASQPVDYYSAGRPPSLNFTANLQKKTVL